MKILIVDDNRDFCATLADVVRGEGWNAEIRNLSLIHISEPTRPY